MKTVVAKYEDLTRWDVKRLLVNDMWSGNADLASLSDLLVQRKEVFRGHDAPLMLSIHFGGTVSERKRQVMKGSLFIAHAGDIVFSKIDARNGALCMIPKKYKQVAFTSEFPIYKLKSEQSERVSLEYLELVLLSPQFLNVLNSLVSGASGRKRITPSQFEDVKVPIPDIKTQNKIVADFRGAEAQAKHLQRQANDLEEQMNRFLMQELGVENEKQAKSNSAFVVSYKDLSRWSVGFSLWSNQAQSRLFETLNLDQIPQAVELMQRGKSPKYKESTGAIVLNQKCNRWNNIDITHAKTVDPEWLSSIESRYLLQHNDIVINSTGEGTIGRASVVNQASEGLFYDSHMLLLRLNTENILPQYFVSIFNSEYGQKQVGLIKSAQSTKQTELGLDNLGKITFPLPSLEIQRRIVTKMEKMHAKIMTTREQYTSIIQSAKNDLMTAIALN